MQSHRATSTPSAYRQRVLGGLVLWLFAGGALLAGGLLPMHCALLGWSLPYWLLLAPVMLLLTLEPSLPRRLLRRPRKPGRVWN